MRLSDHDRARLRARWQELSGPYYKPWRRLPWTGYGDEVKSTLLILALDEIDRRSRCPEDTRETTNREEAQ